MAKNLSMLISADDSTELEMRFGPYIIGSPGSPGAKGDPGPAGSLNTADAATLSTAAANAQAAQSSIASIANATNTDAGTLTGAEVLPVSVGGLLQTTLTKIAQWVIQTYQGFTQNGTGAVARTVANKLAERVSVRDFGAVGSASVDDSAAINAALSYLNSIGGGVLDLCGMYLRCDNQLVGYSNTIVRGNGATLDYSYRASYMTTDYEGLFKFAGTAAAEINLTADATLESNTITVADASTLSVGDMIELRHNSSNTGWWSDPSVGVYSGQLNIITGISGNTLTLDTTIFETLSMANSPTVRKITPVSNVVVEGLTMIGKGRPQPSGQGDLGLMVYFGKHVTVRDCTFKQVDSICVRFTETMHFVIDNCNSYHDPQGANGTVNYGFVYSNSQYGVISRNRIVNPRHGVVSSHTSAAYPVKYYGVSRFITICDNYITGTWHAGVATHNDVEYVYVLNNTMENCWAGINFRDRNQFAVGNRITNCTNGMYLSNAAQKQVWRGNYVADCLNGFIMQGLNTGFVTQDILVEGNVISGYGTKANCLGMVLSSASGVTTTNKNIVVRNNKIENVLGAGGGSSAIRFNGYLSGDISDNVIHNCSGLTGIRIDTAPAAVTMRRNRVTNTTTAFSINNASTDCYCTDNYIKGYTTGYSGVSNTTNRNNDDGGATAI